MSAVPSDSRTETAACRDGEPTSVDMMGTDASTPKQSRGVCDASPDNRGRERANKASRPSPFERNGILAHTFGQTQAISTWIPEGRRHAAGTGGRRGKGHLRNKPRSFTDGRLGKHDRRLSVSGWTLIFTRTSGFRGRRARFQGITTPSHGD